MPPKNLFEPPEPAEPNSAAPKSVAVGQGSTPLTREFGAAPNSDKASPFGSTMPDPFHGGQNSVGQISSAIPGSGGQPTTGTRLASGPAPGFAALPGQFNQAGSFQMSANNFPAQNSAPAAAPTSGQSANSPVNGAAYLDEIAAAPAGKSALFSGKMKIVLGALILAILLFVILAAASGSKKTNPAAEILSVKLSNLSALIQYEEQNPVSGAALNKTVAEAQLSVDSQIYALGQIYSDNKLFKTPGSTATANYGNKTALNDLATAKSAGNLDAAFQTELSKELIDTQNEIAAADKGAGSKTDQALRAASGDFAELARRLGQNTSS
ncbi:MAG: hypothetical protein LBM73_03050 [Candidatus Nomurabacteria bacterium]|jgi:hypothetical protein|nr:hypothetical protein [Candidatus Nomurabacteria bacterium]